MKWKQRFYGSLMILTLLLGCGKDNGEEVTPSEFQLNFFSDHQVGFYYNPPTLMNGDVYIGTSRSITYTPTSNNYFYKLNASLTKVWEYPLQNFQVIGAASIDSDGNIYFIADSGRTCTYCDASIYLYSLDPNGNFRWKYLLGSNVNESGMMNPAIAADNTVYAGGINSFYAFYPDGTVKWNYVYAQNDGPVRTAPCIDPSGNIYFSALGTAYSLDANGNERWQLVVSTSSGSSPAFNTDYSSLILANHQTIYNISTINGAINWTYSIMPNADLRSSPAVDENNVIYIGSHGDGNENDESTLFAIKADGSGLLWQKNIGSDLYSSPALGSNHVLYIGSEGNGFTDDRHNRLHAINMTSGDILWSAELDMDVTFSSPAISDGGVLYIACMDINGEKSGVYSFNTGSGGLLYNAAWPRFHGGNSSTGRRE